MERVIGFLELGVRGGGESRGEGEPSRPCCVTLRGHCPCSRPQFPASASEFIEDAHEILHVKML